MIWCYLFIACFDWKIDLFRQTVVKIYYILNLTNRKKDEWTDWQMDGWTKIKPWGIYLHPHPDPTPQLCTKREKEENRNG